MEGCSEYGVENPMSYFKKTFAPILRHMWFNYGIEAIIEELRTYDEILNKFDEGVIKFLVNEAEDFGMKGIMDLLVVLDEETFTQYLVDHHEMIKSEDLGQACNDAGFIDPENYEPDRDENG